MSDFPKKVNQYRRGEDWQSNFKYIDYHNVANSVKSILTKQEFDKVLDRLGNHAGTTGKRTPLSVDEKVFRICVLLDTQAERIFNEGRQSVTRLDELLSNREGNYE